MYAIIGSRKWYKFTCRITWKVFFLAFTIYAFAYGEDKLIIQDSTGNQKVSLRDDGSILLNTDTWAGPSWAKLFGEGAGNIGFAFYSSGDTADSGGGGAQFARTRGTTTSPSAVQNGDRAGYFVFSGYDGASFVSSAGLTAKVDNAVSSGNVPMKLVFETNPTGWPREERMVISSDGYIGISTSTPNHLIDTGQAYCDGTAWMDGSSRDYKQDIQSLQTEEAVNALKDLNPVKFRYKTDPSDERLGFIAEDVPDIVATKDRKGMSSMEVVAILTKTLQAQQETISQLQSEIAALKQAMDQHR